MIRVPIKIALIAYAVCVVGLAIYFALQPSFSGHPSKAVHSEAPAHGRAA